MLEPEEITLTTPGYWVDHIEQLVALLDMTSSGVISDPLGRPVDPDQMVTLTSPGGWVEHPEALADALADASEDGTDLATVGGSTLRSGVAGPVGERLVLTVEEAAGLLGISRAFAYEAVNRGEIPSIRIGRRILVPKVALERLLDSTDPPPPPGR